MYQEILWLFTDHLKKKIVEHTSIRFYLTDNDVKTSQIYELATLKPQN